MIEGLVIGKAYRNGIGQKVTITGSRKGPFGLHKVFSGDNGYSYNAAGAVVVGAWQRDLVGEWVEDEN